MTFVVVNGMQRTGTSLMMDIVEKAGYELGDTTGSKKLRNGRNESPTERPNKNPLTTREVEVMTQKIDAMKLFYDLNTWVDHLTEVEDLKIIFTSRDFNTWNDSISDKLNMEGNTRKRRIYKFCRNQAQAIKRLGYDDWMIAPFHKVTNGDMGTFKQIKDILDYEGGWVDLTKPVEPEVVKYDK